MAAESAGAAFGEVQPQGQGHRRRKRPVIAVHGPGGVHHRQGVSAAAEIGKRFPGRVQRRLFPVGQAVVEPPSIAVQRGEDDLIGGQGVRVHLPVPPADCLQKGPIARPVVAQEGPPVFEHRLGGLFGVVEGIVPLPEVVLDDADLLPQGRQGPAVCLIGHPQIPGHALCLTDRLPVGGIDGGQPLGKQGHLRLRGQVGLQLSGNDAKGVALAGGAHQRHQVVIAAVFRDQRQVPAQGIGPVIRQPAQDHPEHPALAQAPPDVPAEEQDLHGQVRVLRIGPDKAPDDVLLLRRPDRADGREQVQAVGACAGVGHRAVFRAGDVRLIFQLLQHMHSSCSMAREQGTTRTP